MNSTHTQPLPTSHIWIALRLPFMPLEAWGIPADGDAHVLVSDKNRIVSASQKSLTEVNLGAPTSTAQMMLNAKVIANDDHKNRTLLDALTRIVYQFTPHYKLYGSDAILLEVSSCVKLFKSAQNLLDKLLAALQQGYQTYCEELVAEGQPKKSLTIALGTAHTPLGAWLLSFKHLPLVFEDLPDRALTALKACELDYLAEHTKVVERLKRTGFSTLGDLFLQNGFELRDRYGSAFIDYIGGILGVRLAESARQHPLPLKSTRTRPTETPEQVFMERFELDSPTSSLAELQDVFKCLLLLLQQYLHKLQRQCDKVRWRLYSIHNDESVHVLNIPGLHSQWEFALELTRLHFDSTELPFEIDSVVLDCVNIAPLEGATPSLFGASGDTQNEQKLLTTLNARLGKNAVFKLQYVDSHIPECTTQKVAVSAKSTDVGNTQLTLPTSDRPTWLLCMPQRLRCSPKGLFYKGKLQLLSGPERIQQLWSDEVVWRDYFIAMQEDATRLWVFKDLRNQQWYLHGLF